MKMNRRALLKQVAACSCPTVAPLGQIQESRCASASDCTEEDAARVSCLVDWSRKTEGKWFELVAVILDEFNPEVSRQETKRRLADWFEQIVKSLEEFTYFAIETLETAAFLRKQPCLEALVRSKGEERPETVFLHTLDLLRLMFPVGYFQEDPQLSHKDRVSFHEQLNRIRRRHPDHYRRLAETTLILNQGRFQMAWELWSSQNSEADGRDMQEGLALLRGEPLLAFSQA
jgi:hypothetical protein